MRLVTSSLILWLSLGGGLAQSDTSPDAEESYSDWGLRHIRGSFESVNNYFDSFLELLGGKNGICQYRCRYGKAPMPRPNYKPQEPNGCSSHFLGVKMDLGIPAMTKCCNQLDVCYDTCGANKYRCDAKFRWCLHSICSDLKRSLGFVSNVESRECSLTFMEHRTMQEGPRGMLGTRALKLLLSCPGAAGATPDGWATPGPSQRHKNLPINVEKELPSWL
ncbi:group XIIB secretory phospholipase A2-like protein isoform X2 [Phyllostomus discolor]|uniref:Group XIIB secretory phospholipase A2-like protein isoform X2 n=1 Tax=Phyllostomus discolor TaxID=89673 RepID=A0A7E6DUM9_9CHIR|nr:group XIIB secretory phospholipase A2-like protein isoform X2 [Phyllostomus discolor]